MVLIHNSSLFPHMQSNIQTVYDVGCWKSNIFVCQVYPNLATSYRFCEVFPRLIGLSIYILNNTSRVPFPYLYTTSWWRTCCYDRLIVIGTVQCPHSSLPCQKSSNWSLAMIFDWFLINPNYAVSMQQIISTALVHVHAGHMLCFSCLESTWKS